MATAHRFETRPTSSGERGADGRGPTSSRTLTLGRRAYPVTLPNIRDPRLQVAAVIVTIHVLGQVALGFHVSVPQILAAILTCAVIEVVLTFRRHRELVWPASAMLTGSGVALILRVPSTPRGDHWTTHALVRVRCRRRRLVADEVRHPLPRLAPVQPVEHRARRRLPLARQHAESSHWTSGGHRWTRR